MLRIDTDWGHGLHGLHGSRIKVLITRITRICGWVGLTINNFSLTQPLSKERELEILAKLVTRAPLQSPGLPRILWRGG